MYLIHDDKLLNRQIWASIENFGKGEIWEFSVYGLRVSGDPVTAPSLRMACELLDVDPLPILANCSHLAEMPLKKSRSL